MWAPATKSPGQALPVKWVGSLLSGPRTCALLHAEAVCLDPPIAAVYPERLGQLGMQLEAFTCQWVHRGAVAPVQSEETTFEGTHSL